MTPAQVRRIALSLPGSVEKDHHGKPSFRIDDKIFATLWDEEHLNVMLDPLRIMDVIEEHPKVLEELWWGRQLRCVRVNLKLVSSKLMKELLAEAWKRKSDGRKQAPTPEHSG